MMRAHVLGNRWDELDGRLPDVLPRVSVIVAHYAQPRELARTLAALARQDYPADRIEVIVTDDGSPDEPVVPAGIRLVRQEDRGFRVSAARNLGVAASTGEVLCLLDADTTPEPGYVRALTRLPALSPEAVTVGYRRHADLADLGPDVPIEDAGPPRALDEPGWLADAYARSANLLHADDRSYRYLIGAVLACSRAFFDEIGGFDETFRAYGGEDWEWAHRAWQAGGVFAHVPSAVAWHDGPDWAGRALDERERAANRESLRLASDIPVEGSRGRGLLTAQPDIAITLAGSPTAAAAFVCVDALLAVLPHASVRVAEPARVAALAADPRVHDLEAPEPDARVHLELQHPVIFDDAGADALRRRIAALGTGEDGSFEVCVNGVTVGSAIARRALRRRARWGDDAGFRVGAPLEQGVHLLRPEPHVEAYLGGWGGLAQLI